MKKVLVITYYWPPSGGAGVQRWLKFVKYLPQFGWEPIVLTVSPEDASYPVIDQTFEKEVPEGIKIIRTSSNEMFRLYKKISKSDSIPSAAFANDDHNSFPQKVARFIRGNLFIPDPRKGWNRYAVAAASKLLGEEQIECIITSGPPHSTHLIGLKLSKVFSKPWIVDMRDPWTDLFYFRQMYPTLISRLLNLRLENKVLSTAFRVITVGPSLKERFLHKHNLNKEKVRVVYNGFDEDDFQNLPQSSTDSFTITYVGTLSDQYNIKTLIQVLHKNLGKYTSLKLQFVGSVSAGQRKELECIPAENLEFIPHVNHRKAIEYMASSNLLLLVIPEHSTAKAILTGKLYEYLATGNPILGIGPTDGDSASILSDTSHGVMIDYRDEEGMEEVLQNYMDARKNQDQSEKNEKYLDYSRRTLTHKLVEILDETLERN